MGHRLENQETGVQFLKRPKDYFLLQCIQTSSGDYPASYSLSNGSTFFMGKEARAWSWLLTQICTCSVMPDIKPNVKYRFCMATILLFHILQRTALKTAYYFKISHTISEPYISGTNGSLTSEVHTTSILPLLMGEKLKVYRWCGNNVQT